MHASQWQLQSEWWSELTLPARMILQEELQITNKMFLLFSLSFQTMTWMEINHVQN